MSTTSIKLPADLKLKAAAVAEELGMSQHAFMVEAIRRATREAELRAQFIAEANAARTETLASGKGYKASEVHAYLRAKIAGEDASEPEAKPWRS